MVNFVWMVLLSVAVANSAHASSCESDLSALNSDERVWISIVVPAFEWLATSETDNFILLRLRNAGHMEFFQPSKMIRPFAFALNGRTVYAVDTEGYLGLESSSIEIPSGILLYLPRTRENLQAVIEIMSEAPDAVEEKYMALKVTGHPAETNIVHIGVRAHPFSGMDDPTSSLKVQNGRTIVDPQALYANRGLKVAVQYDFNRYHEPFITFAKDSIVEFGHFMEHDIDPGIVDRILGAKR